MILKPWFSSPSRLPMGTSTLSNSRYVEPFLRRQECSGRQDSGRSDVITAGVYTRIGNVSAGYAFRVQGDDQGRYSGFPRTTGTDSSRAVVSPHAIGDPFLGSVHNVLVSLSLRQSGDSCNIGTSCKNKSATYFPRDQSGMTRTLQHCVPLRREERRERMGKKWERYHLVQ